VSQRVLASGRAVVVLAAILSISAPAIAQTCGTVANGSFENGGTANGILTPGSTAIAPWEVIAAGVDWISGLSGVVASQGTNFLALTGGAAAAGVRQTVCTQAGRRYMLTFDMNSNPAAVAGTTDQLLVSAAGVSDTFSLRSSGSTSPPWRRGLVLRFTATSASTVIEFRGAGSKVLLDNVNLSAVQLAGCVPAFSERLADDSIVFSYNTAVPAAASTKNIIFDLNPACTWAATKNVPWITLQPSAGTGPGSLQISVAANPSSASRTGAVFMNGRRLVLTQAGTTCDYSITPGSKNAAANFSNDISTIRVSAPPGCSWQATTDAAWIELLNTNGEGNGFVRFNMSENTSPQRRSGSIFAAGQLFTVSQAGAGNSYACETFSAQSNSFRLEGLAEGAEGLNMTCTGPVPAGGATGDVLVTYNALITSKLTGPATDDLDAWLILNETVNPVPGTTAFRGKLAGPTAIKFTNVPLTNVVNGTASFRFVNVRVNASSLPPLQQPRIAAHVQIQSLKFIPVSNSFTVLNSAQPALSATVGGVEPVNGGTHQMLPVTFSESVASSFRPKDKPTGSTIILGSDSESLFKHPNLGSQAGQADTGTRLRLRIPVPAGVRVWAPTTVAGNVDARLVSADDNGVGGSVVSGSALFGGTYQELTSVNGFATAVWEVMAADPLLVESATAQLVFQGGDLTAITRGLMPSLAPLNARGTPDATSPVPRFLDPVAAPAVVNLRVTPKLQRIGPSSSGKDPVRETVGSNYRLSYEVANDGSDDATNVVVRGNVPPGFNYTSCSRTDGGACSITGGEARAQIPSLPGGQKLTFNVNATQVSGFADGNVLEHTVSASSDQFDADVQSNQASTPFLLDNCNVTLSSSSANVPGSGGSGTFSFGACVYWVIRADVPWITITSAQAGTGAGVVAFSVAQNDTAAPRAGTIVAAGQTYTVNQSAAGDSCTYSIGRTAATSGAGGLKGIVTLTVAGIGCSWSASSSASWLQVYPLTGTGTMDIEYTVFPNFSAQQRSAILNIAGRTFTMMQSANTLNGNERFVQLIYFSFLGRLPSPTDLAQQVGALNAGTTRGQLVLNFFNSEEFNLGGRLVAGLYVGLLNRDAEYSGWLFQRNALATGVVGQVALVTNFLGSAEWALKFGAPSDADYVRLLYRYVLLREAGDAEVALQVNAINNRIVNRTTLANAFLNSGEFRNGTGPRLIAFLLYATLLQREASPEERNALAQQVAAGTPLLMLINNFINSQAFTAGIN
jgi:uncharacterized repeat protein (TIGR01451 family)